MFADEIRRQAEAAPRAALPAVTAALWRAYGEGKVTEAEAEALSGLIEARRQILENTQILHPSGAGPQDVGSTHTPGSQGDVGKSDTSSNRVGRPRTAVGSRPRTDTSMERRRRWAASGRLPPALAARFTLAEQAVLALVAAEVVRRKDCRLSVENMAAVAGVCRSTVKNAIREARQLGLLTVEERQITGFRNDTNVVRVVSREWQAWLRLTRQEAHSTGNGTTRNQQQGGGVKSVTTTPTEVLDLGKTRPAEPLKGCREAASDFGRSDPVRILAGGMTGRAMR
jgi:hypothetical protein